MTADLAQMIERQVNHMVRLVDDLMEVSRVTRGKIELRKETVDLRDVIASAVETCRPFADAARHELAVTLPPVPLVVHADAVRLAQVFSNLLNNAIRYTDQGGRIALNAERNDGQAVVTVTDSGIGIAPEMLPRVFDMFVQAEHSGRRGQAGLGIGLTLVRSLVHLHGGTVAVASAGLGKGSKFTVQLPIAARPVERLPVLQGTPSLRGAPRVLVVDDNRDAADSLGVLLRMLGADVRVVHDGAAALRAFEEFHPVACFVDLGMPGMDGFEVAQRIRARADAQGAVLIAHTGWGRDKDRDLTLAAGFDEHLVKPADLNALQAVLAALGG
jgi:CheY-like chemotaxis protein